jgi:putative membrane-bound dehydrogenase-like protein
MKHAETTRPRSILIAGMVCAFVGASQLFCGQPIVQSLDNPSAAEALEPADALKSFELHAGFRVELVADEPLVQDPVALAFDENGVMFVVEYPEFNHYRIPRELQRTGRVRRLQDTDGDGRFDQATVFVEVPFATAVTCYDGGVFVGAPPDILYCRDVDADGVADEKRVVLTGFGRDFAGGGLLNSFRWGIDNRIHIATGFAGGRVRRPDQNDAEAVDIRGRGVILDPRSLEFELTSGGGQHGLAMDDRGRKFLCSNVYPLQQLLYDDRYAARNPFFAPPAPARDINAEDPLAPLKRISPLEPWRVARSRIAAKGNRRNGEEARAGGVFTSASGITMYRGDAFPDEFYGNLFVGEVANNLVYRVGLESRGIEQAALRADHDAEFLASRDTWFRPVQFANGPDGALYVVDMYRQLIEGAAFVTPESLKKLDPSLGTDRGRIYRIVPRDYERRRSPSLGKLSTPELVRLLEHPNGWHRDTAARLLSERRDPAAIAPLADAVRTSDIPLARLLALSSLQTLDAIGDGLLRFSINDADPRVREHAVRLSEPFAEDSSSLRDALFARVADPDLNVRFQLAFSLGELRGSRRDAVLAELAHRDADNPLLMVAVQSSLVSGAGDVFARLATDQKAVAQDPIQKLMLDLVAQIGLQSDSGEVAAVLQSLSAIEARDPEFAQTIKRTLFTGIRRDQLRRLTADGSTQQMFERLVAQARSSALDNSLPVARRLEAVRTLSLADFDMELRQLLKRLLGRDQPVPVQLAACETLARFDDPRVANLVLDQWPHTTPAVRRSMIETLLSRSVWTTSFLDAVATRVVSPDDVDRSRIEWLLTRSNEDTIVTLRRLFPTDRREGRKSVIAEFQSSLKMTGDARRGRQVYERVCAACHKRGSLGKDVGPPLIDTASRPAEALLIDILAPNRQVKPLFQSYVLHTTDGRVYTGMIGDESSNAVRLHQTDGTSREVLRIQIETLKSTGMSFMPEGLEKTINRQAMADLLKFLTARP